MTYACLINGNVETTCTLTTSEDLIVSDDYLLSYVHSENKTKMLTFTPVKMTIELFPLSSEPQQTTQTITSFDTPLIVKVSNDYSTGYCLPLYYDDSKELTNCDIFRNYANYYLPNTFSNGEYIFYYKSQCAHETISTGITLTVNVDTIKVISLKLPNGESSTTEDVTEIVLTFDTIPIDSIHNIILSDVQDNSYTVTFSTCTYVDTTITCTNPSVIPRGGEYSILSINGAQKYDFTADTIDNIIIDKLGKQLTSQLYIPGSINSFVVYLASTNIATPLIYVGDGEDSITCSREENQKLILLCEMNAQIMPTNGLYSIYYKGASDRRLDTGITITKQDSNGLTIYHVIKIFFEGDSDCLTYKYSTQFYFSLSDNGPDTTSEKLKAILIKNDDDYEISFTCKKDGSTTKYVCSNPSITIVNGFYSLKSISGTGFFFDLSTQLKSNSLRFLYPSTTDNFNQIRSFVADTTHSTFFFKFPSTADENKNIYYQVDGNYEKVENCKLKKEFIVCDIADIKGEINDSFGSKSIYYKTICQNYEMASSTVYFNTANYINIGDNDAIDIFKNDNTKCSTNPLESFTVEFEYPVTNLVETWCLDLDGKFLDDDGGSINGERKITYNLTSPITTGEYYVSLIKTSSINFQMLDITKIPSRIIKVVPEKLLSSIQENMQIIDFNKKTFIVNLDEGATITPLIYVNNMKVKCVRSDNLMTCTPNFRHVSESEEFNLFYIDYCDSIVQSEIVIRYKFPINVNSVTLIDDKTCSISPFTTIKLIIDKVKQEDMTTVKSIITNINDSSISFEFETCEHIEDSTIITCITTSTISKGEYKLTSVIGNNDYIIQENKVEYIEDSLEGREQITPQTVMKKTPSFKILLASSSIINLNVYVKKEEEYIAINCQKEDGNDYIECSLNNDDMLVETSYLIYYENSCGDIISTGIVVNNVLPKQISVQSLSLSNNKRCTQAPFTEFIMTIDIEETGFVKNAILSKDGIDISFTCESIDTTITCRTEEEIADGTYTLKEVNGDDTYLLSLVDNELKYVIDPLGTQTVTTYTLKKSSPSFKVQLKDKNTVKPKIYNSNEENKKEIQCTKEAEDSFITCTPTLTELKEYNKENIIYYEDSCGDIKSTGISVTYVSKTISIQTLSFENSSTCSTSQFNKFKMIIDIEPAGIITKATLTNNIVDSDFTCTINLLTVTCETQETLPQGTYTLKEIIGDDTYLQSSLDSNELKYVNEVLDNQQLDSVEVTKGKPTFIIQLKSSTTPKPNVYILQDETKKLIECQKETDDSFITCQTTNELMPEETGYLIYYEDQCGELQSTGITVNKKLSKTIKISKMSITEDLTCSLTPFTSFTMTINDDPTGEVTSAKFRKDNKEISFPCNVNGRVITCEAANVEEGTYHLESITGDDTYELDLLSELDLKYETEPLSEQIEKSQTINKNIKQFKVLLASTLKTPNIYVEGDKNKKVTCENNPNDENELLCTPNDSIMPESKIYEIYYEGACGEIKTTGITINHVLTSTVTVNALLLVDDSICASNPFNSFKISLESEPKGKILYAILTNDDIEQKTYNFTKCEISSITVICTIETDTIVGGSYKLTEIEGDDTYVLKNIESSRIKYEPNPLEEITETTITIDKTTKEFSIPLASPNTIPPTIYVGGDDNKKILSTCNKEGSILVCDPSDSDMPTTGIYDIYYEGQCGAITNTLIKIHYVLTSIVEVKNLTLIDDALCTPSTFTDFQLTLGSEPKGSIHYAILTSDNTEYNFTKCDIISTKVTCSILSSAIIGGSYKIKEIEGDDTYILTDIDSITIKYDDMDNLLGIQKTPQQLNGDNKNVIVSLFPDKNIIPVLYLRNDDNKEELKCELNTNNTNELICTPETIDWTKDGEYLVYYKGACDNLLFAGITLNYIAPISITVTSVYLSETITCSALPITKFSFSTDVLPTTAVSEAILINDKVSTIQYTFNECEVTTEKDRKENDIYIITCSKEDNAFIPGTYTLFAVKGADTYSISQVQSIKLKYDVNPLKEQLNTNQKVNADTPTFIIELSSEETIIPKIYIEDNTVIVNNCVKKETEPSILECTPTLKEMSETKEYKIFYEAECEEIKFTNITVYNILPIVIEVTSVTLSDGVTCRTDEISLLLITIDKEPTSSISKAILTDGTKDYEFESCEYNDFVISCTTNQNIRTNGEYILKEIKAADDYIVDSVSESKLILNQENVLAEQIKEQTVNKESPTFTIVLASEVIEVPKIFLGNDEEMECQCERKDDTMICTLNEDNMTESMKYEINYKNICGNLASTGVTVIYINEVTKEEEVIIVTHSKYMQLNKILVLGLLLIML